MSSMPPKGSTIAIVAQYLLNTGVNEKSLDDANNPKLPKFAKFYSFELSDLTNALLRADGKIPLEERMKGLIPNLAQGPLSYDQKVFIRDKLKSETASSIATWVRSATSNVTLAKRGEFVAPRPVPAHDSTRPYGPLTYKEQLHIRDNCKEHNTRDLANKYNTHYNNIYRAQRGQFSQPAASKLPESKRPFGPLSLYDKREIRDHRSDENINDLVIEYNTHYQNVKLAQQGKFKDAKPQGPSILEQHEKLLAGLMGHGYMIMTGLDSSSAYDMDEFIKEILA